MKAVLSIELEVLEPAIVSNAKQLQELFPSQIGWVSIRLNAHGEAGESSTTYAAQTDDVPSAVRDLVVLAQKSQPEGTAVRVWYKGRSESFMI